MSEMFEKSVWSSGNSRERTGELHKSLTAANRLMKPMFPKIRKDEEQETGVIEEDESDESETSTSSSSSEPRRKTFTLDEVRGRARSFMEKALKKRGYPTSLLDNEDFYSNFVRSLVEDGEVVSERTGRAWIERAVPEEAPAFVRPGKLKIGDRIQVLNWVPLGVHGTTVDLFPKGRVSKIYEVKCLVSKDPMTPGCMFRKGSPFEEQQRVLGLELDGKGPYSVKGESEETAFPYITKDSTVIVRFPPMSLPTGESEHVSPAVM